MYLKRLEIQGFKSFARKTTLEFEPGITAIVGPNGSGKSNVADCLRWVLGEQSTKLLRGKKSEDVIFAGSDKKTKLSFAEVSATFDNRDHKIPVDAAEVSIGRRIDRSGESEYLLNGNRVRLLDIVDLVLKSNIGTSRYTVIGQGTIDNMILTGPSEIKNLLDEASGVKTYYIKRDRTLRRLEQTAQNLMRAEDLINEIEPRLKSLRRQAKRMEARSEIEVELKRFQADWYDKQYWELQTVHIQLSESLSGYAKNRAGLESRIGTLRHSIETFENNNQSAVTTYGNLQTELAQLQDRKNKLMEQVSLIRGKMESQKSGSGDKATLEVESHQLQTRKADLEAQVSATEQEAARIQERLTQSAELLRHVNTELDSLYVLLSKPEQVDAGKVSDKLSQLDELINQFTQQVTDAESVSEVGAYAAQFKDHYRKLSIEVRKLMSEGVHSVGVQHKLQELSKEKDRLNEALNQLQVQNSRAGLTKQFLQNQLNDLAQEAMRLDLALKQATSTDSGEFIKELAVQEVGVQADIQKITEKISSLEADVQSRLSAERDEKQRVNEAEKQGRSLMDELSQLRDAETKVEVEKAKIDTQLEALLSEIVQAIGQEGLHQIKQEQRTIVDPELFEKITKLKHQLELIGGVDELTIKEYEETETRYTGLSAQVADLKKGMDDLRQIIEELDEHIKTTFNESFHKVNEKFEQYFRTLFNGGIAHLSIVRGQDKPEEEELAEGEADVEPETQLRPEEKIVQKYEKGSTNIVGVDIKATPPGKKLSTIQALSGGERSLTSIALLCSLLSCFPSPFVVLDEVDAALDEANTIRFGQILGTLSHQTQFITITHNRETMSQSNAIYGVTMGDDGISKLLSIKFDQATIFAK